MVPIPGLPPLNLTGGAGGAAGPSTAEQYMQGMTSGMFDSSGWTVATGGSKATASGTGSGAGLSAIPWAMIALAGVAAIILWRKLK